jgi:hypothetical protein
LAEDSAVLIGNGKRITKVKTSHSGFILSWNLADKKTHTHTHTSF